MFISTQAWIFRWKTIFHSFIFSLSFQSKTSWIAHIWSSIRDSSIFTMFQNSPKMSHFMHFFVLWKVLNYSIHFMWEMTFKKPRLIEGSSSSLCGQNLEGLIVVGSNPGSSKKGKTWRTTKIPGIHWDVKVAWASVRGSDFWLPQTPVAIVHLSWRVVFSDWNNAKHWFGHFHYWSCFLLTIIHHDLR